MVRALVAAALLLLSACKAPDPDDVGKKVLYMPLRAAVGNLDSVFAGGSQYSNDAATPLYDTLLEYEYLTRPYVLKPAMLAKMPSLDAAGVRYEFELQKGLRFQDHACFEGGRGREIIADDVFYSIKRMGDPYWTPHGWWIYQGRIKGLDAWRDAEMKARGKGERFSYDAPVPGLEKISDHRFVIELVEPFPQFLYLLAMVYSAVVPRECVELYDREFAVNPVGSGPFKLAKFVRGNKVVLERNPNFREQYFPTKIPPALAGRGFEAAAGRKLPQVDRIVMTIYEQDQPMWLKFRVGDLDYSQIPAEFQASALRKLPPDQVRKQGRRAELREQLRRQGITDFQLPILDFIYRGFNMEDPVYGRGPGAKKLRQAISLAMDLEEFNRSFYEGYNVIYSGPIPPGLSGFDPKRVSPYAGPDLERARQLVREAGYDPTPLAEAAQGRRPPALDLEVSISSSARGQAELLTRQLARIGVELRPHFNTFPELTAKLNKNKAQFFGLAWGADYPDAENFLSLFYGPNKSPGNNHFNYQNPEYDALFEKARLMVPGPEREALYEQLREMLIEDVPFLGSMARTRFYVVNPRLKFFFPDEVMATAVKFVDVEPVKP